MGCLCSLKMNGVCNFVKPCVSGDEGYSSLHSHDTMLQDTSPAQETLQVLRVIQVPNVQQRTTSCIEGNCPTAQGVECCLGLQRKCLH